MWVRGNNPEWVEKDRERKRQSRANLKQQSKQLNVVEIKKIA